jgi:hypothetical protein
MFLFCAMPFVGNAAVDLSSLADKVRALDDPSLLQYADQMGVDDPVIQAQAVKKIRVALFGITGLKVFNLIKDLDNAYVALLTEKVCTLKDLSLSKVERKLKTPGKIRRGVQALILSNKDVGIDAGFAMAVLDDRSHVILKCKAMEYFANKFGDSLQAVSFMEKESGIQAGNIVRVTLTSGETIDYYTKTHLGGLKSGGSNSAKPVDIRELFVYKFLEYSGLGPEVHFFWDDLENFYIAARDASPDAVHRFLTYDQVRDKKSLGGVTNYKRWDLTSEDKVNPMIIEALVMSDVVGRIFGLSDLITNSGNIGFICNDNQITAYKIIDFSFGRISRPNAIFPGFLGGNDIRFYLGAVDKIVNYFLGTPKGQERIAVARERFKPRVFSDAIDAAEKEVQSLELSSNALAIYVAQVKANVNAFAKGLELPQS